jgi:hypothetical protein
MTKEARNPSDKIVGRLCRTPWRFAFVFSAKGAVFIASLGQRPRVGGKTNISAEGAIRFSPPELRTRVELIRAFSACLLGVQIPGAMPQADNDIAPLALNTHRSAETPYNNCGVVINSSFVIRASSFSPS